MGCDCSRSSSPDFLVNTFWKSLKLREKDYKIIVEMIHCKKRQNMAMCNKKLLIMIECLIKGELYHEETIAVFDKGFKYAQDQGNEGFFYLSLILLGKGSKKDFIEAFVDIAMTVGGMKSSMIIEEKEQKKQIKKSILLDFFQYHIDFITLLPIGILSTLSERNDLFVRYWHEKVIPSKIEEFINDVIMINYNQEGYEWIDLDNFLNDSYYNLIDDICIRDYLLDNVNMKSLPKASK